MMDWAFVGFVILVGSFLAFMLFATFYDWSRKDSFRESGGKPESRK